MDKWSRNRLGLCRIIIATLISYASSFLDAQEIPFDKVVIDKKIYDNREAGGIPWYENPIILYDWIRIGEDLTEEYAHHLIQKTKDLNANTLAFCVQVGGYALWNSKVTPKYSRIGDMDLIGELAKLCRKNNLYFVPWWLGTSMGVARILYEHPSWAYLGPPQGDKPGKRWHYICYNTPYRELLYEEVREILSNYEVDGIYFDQLPGSCYCPNCQAKFERIYGQSMPIVPEEEVVPLLPKVPPAHFPPLLREFRDNSIRSFCAGIRKIIDEVQPGVCYAQNWIKDHQARLGLGFVDVVLPEFYQRTDLIPLGMKHRITRAYFDNGPIWGNIRHSVFVEARHFPVRGTKMLLMDCVANLAAPLMLDLNAMDFDPTGKEELAKTFKDISEIQKLQSQAEPVRYAALLHSLKSYENYPERYLEGFEGMYRLLLESHIPFEIVNEKGVQQGQLKDYKVMIIPDAVFLTDKTVEAIQRAVKKGMGLVATHMTGLRDEKGHRRAKPALADIFGFELVDIIAHDTKKASVIDPILGVPDIDKNIFYYGSARTNHPLARDIPEKSFFSFQGGFVACHPNSGAEVIADIHPPDNVRLNARPYNRRGVFPGPARWPLALVRKYGKARVAYFAPQADAQWRRAHAPELDSLLRKCILWTGGTIPLETPDVPPSVEVRLFHNKKQRLYSILLINLTTNSLTPSGDNIGVIRYITPLKDLRLILHTNAKVTTVRTLTNTNVQYKIEKKWVQINLSILDLYEGVIIEYE